MSSCLLSLRRVIFWIVKWVPVVFIAALIFWSYYAYVVELNIRTIDSYHEKIPFLIIYHVIFILFLATYYQATFVTIKNPPKQFELSVSDIAKLNSLDNHSETRRQLEIFSKDLPLLTRNFDGEIRYCNICNCIKPDRCHHCSICGQCVLKMDHHCPWINNCVGYSNYKFFVLFLFYAFVYCLWVTSTTMKYFIKFWTNNLPDGGGKFHILFVFFTSSMFALSVSSLLFYHLWLTSKNRSTLESFRAPIFATAGPDANGFNLGWRENFKEIFGNDKFLALLPIRTSTGNGISFTSHYEKRQDISDLIATSNNPDYHTRLI